MNNSLLYMCVCVCVLWLQVVWSHPLWEATKQWTLLLYLARRTKVLCSDSRQVGGRIFYGRTDLLWLILLTIQWQRFWPGVTKLLSKTIITAHWKICSGWIKKLRIECFFHLFIYLLLPCEAAWCNWNTWDCLWCMCYESLLGYCEVTRSPISRRIIPLSWQRLNRIPNSPVSSNHFT